MSTEDNVGTLDRLARIALGAGLLVLFFASPVPSLTLLGIAPLFSGLLGFCPVYYYADLSTARGAAPGTARASVAMNSVMRAGRRAGA